MVDSQKHVEKVVAHYHNGAASFTDKFLSFTADQALGELQRYLPAVPAAILDVGAGPGRDAVWLARQGYKVTAVEPAEGLRLSGLHNSQGLDIVWLDDRLPDLTATTARGQQFDFILLSAVWMFLPPALRQTALQTLAGLLKPGGRIAMTVQTAASERQDLKFFTSPEDFATLAAAASLQLEARFDMPDSQGRKGTRWQSIVFCNPPPCFLRPC